jgi:hypothetical protein
MANFIFTIAKGRFIQQSSLATGADAVLVCLLKSSGLQADATLQDYTTLSTLLASNTEATFTNYGRKVLTSGLTITQNFTTNVQTVAIGNQTWFAAGGASNDVLGKLITAYRPTSASPDSACIPMLAYDFTATTTGSDLIAQFAGGVFGTGS